MVDNLIRLFDSAETEFSTNGIGVLPDAESCVVTEEKNGEFELEMVYPITGKRYSELAMRRIIVAKSNPYSNPQPFRIYSITKPFNGRVTVNAEHISYDMSGYPVPPFTAGSCADALSKLKENCAVTCPFTFWTDKNVTKDFSTNKPYSMRSLLGGVDGSILSVFGKGEYEFDGYLVKLWLNRGKDRGVVIRYGKNLTDIEQEENCSSVYTGVYPYWYAENSEMVSLPEGIVEAEGTYNYTRILTLDLSDRWTEQPSEETLREAAENYIKNNNIGVPDVSLDISFEQLAQTKEYELYSMLEEVHLCDTVHVEFPDLGVSAKADCIKTEYDVLTDKYNKIELGSSKSTLASTIANQEKQLDETLSKTYLERTVENATNLISGNSGGYVVFRNSDGGKQPNEILIMDTPDILTAKKVWRWNKSGLGYSKTGYNGSYGLAMTIDGEINADFMTTGILNAISIRACDIKCGKIEETATRARTLRAAANEKYAFELSTDGSITATKGVIGLCTIDEDGRLIVPAAHITDLLTAEQIDATDLKVAAANVTGQLVASQINAANLEITGSNSLYNYSYSISPDALLFKQGDTELLRADKNGITLTGEIKASKGTIGGFTIGSTAIYSSITSMYDSEHSGVYLGTNGIRLGLLNAFSVDTSGSLKANKGTIGGWTISDSGLSKTETVSDVATTIRLQTSYGSGSGTGDVSTINPVFEVVYGGTSKFYVRRNGYLHAEDANIKGTITASSGKIGTWNIGTQELFSGSSGISTHSDYTKPSLVTSGSDSKVIFYSGNSDRISGNFVVLDDGSLYAKAADISGKITASSGKIAGLEIGTESRTIGSTSVTGSVLKTTEADSNFSIFSYNYNGNIGSVLKVKTLELENQEFDDVVADSLKSRYLTIGGTLQLTRSQIRYDNDVLMNFDYAIGGTTVTATLSNSWASCAITISFDKALPAEKTFYLRLHMTWGGWESKTMKVSAGLTTYTQTFSGPFWGWDQAHFSATGSNSYTYSTGSKNYVEFNKHVEPYWNNTYDLGSNTYAWANEYFTTSPVIKSDRNVKKDISNDLEMYSKIFDLLKPSSYKFIDGSSGRTHIGFIAQDVEDAIALCGLTTTDFAGYCAGETDKGEITRSLRYEEFIALNTYEIQKLKKRVDELESMLKVNDAS